MRYLLLAVLLVGCGEVSPAGGIGPGGAAGTDEPGAAGAGGDTGQGGTTGAAGTAGAAPARSCDMPIGAVSGIDTGAEWTRSGAGTGCTNQEGQRVEVRAGAVYNFFHADEWSPKSFTATPSTTGACSVEIRYDRQDPTCGSEHLFVTLTVPAI